MIDFKGIWNLLKADCMVCNWPMEIAMGTKCKKCPFISGSWNTNSKTKKRIPRPAIGSMFAGFGIDEIIRKRIGKHQLFYFLYHSTLEFKYPEIPIMNMFEVKSSSTTYWIIHHVNGNFWDDREYNLILCLNNEHSFFENQTKEAKKYVFNKNSKFVNGENNAI